MMHRILRAAAAGTAVLASSGVSAQDAPLVDVRFKGLAEIEPAAKDADAHAALLTLGSRLRLLPREIPDFEADRAWIGTFWNLVTGSGGLQIAPGDEFPSVSLSLVPQGGTEGVIGTFAEFVETTGGPDFETNEDGSLMLDSPAGPIHISESVLDEREALTLRVGESGVAPIMPLSYDLPAGVEPTLSMSIEIGRLIKMFSDMIEAEEPQAFEQIERFGFLNAGDARAELAAGAEGETAFVSGRLTGAKPWLGRFFGDASFAQDDLRMIPADATVVGAACFDLAWTLDVIRAIGEDTDRDILAMTRESFGIDLESGLLANIGPRWMYYQADSTGGGGVLSAVLVVELRDTDAFAATQASALVHGNQLGSAMGRGYVRSREWQLDGRTVWSAVFPGIPVPIEPSWTVVDGWLVASATPVGLTAAVGHLSGGSSVLDNPLFQQAITDSWPADPVVQITYMDAARFAQKGFGPMSLGASALANAVRQPFNVGAEPGTVMPTYAEFMDGIRPSGAVTVWDGDDLLQRVTTDSSALVHIAATLGQSSGWQTMYMPGMLAGITMPALGRARESAQQVKSSTQVRGVVQGAIILHQDDPDAPVTTDRLIESGVITPELLVSPMGSAWDGGPDIVLREQYGDSSLDSFDASLVVAMDRAMYVNWDDVVNLGFADGHVEALEHWQVDEYLAMPKNAGLREEWQLD